MKHLLTTHGLSRESAIHILDIAEDMSTSADREIKKLPTLRGKTVVNLFFEDSTRTRISFETAEKRLSADVINFSAKGSSVSKGESLKDTSQTLASLGIDAVVIRHGSSGAPEVLAHSGWIDAPVINAGDGTHEHPTQALLDAYTIRKSIHGSSSRGKGLDGLNVCIVGDIEHSRVARSNIWLLNTLGAHVTLVSAPTLVPMNIANWPVSLSFDFDTVLATDQPDVVMMLRIQRERMLGAYFPSTQEYSKIWGLTTTRFSTLPEKTLIMHPGPMNRGLEISSEAADSSQSLILQQVSHGVFVRMAVLYTLLTSDRKEIHG